MDAITITISREGRTSKPKGGLERSLLSEMKPIDIRPHEFLEIVGNLGYSFFPATHSNIGTINRVCFGTSRLLVLDIDNTIEEYDTLAPYAAQDRLYDSGLDCSGIYRTFSDETDAVLIDDEKLRQAKKYRMLFVLEEPVVGADNYEYLLQQLYEIFPEADRRDASSIYIPACHLV